MKINLIVIGHKQPIWIETGYQEYAKRLNKECILQLKELAPFNAKNVSAEQIKIKEAEKIRNAIPKNNIVIALDENGKAFTSEQFSLTIESLLNQGTDISVLIGGAHGLDDTLLNEANDSWSLSEMTLPHGLVRVMIAEQLYRAWSILKCHPYHKI